jgi:peptidoglycan/xylan/chitin deacetylase (PgdA/CDA1 family)
MTRLLAILGLLLTGWLLPPFPLVRLVSRLLPAVLFHVDTRERVVALTLDDGPHPATTGPVLDVLARHRCRATFFLLGEASERHPELVRRIVEQGHELGNHTWVAERSASLGAGEL